MTDILTEQQAQRAILQVLEAVSPDGLEQREVFAALEALESLAVSSALWRNWEEGKIKASWDQGGQELRWSDA